MNNSDQPGCCSQCEGTGVGDCNGKCWDCRGTGHDHSGPCVLGEPLPTQTADEENSDLEQAQIQINLLRAENAVLRRRLEDCRG